MYPSYLPSLVVLGLAAAIALLLAVSRRSPPPLARQRLAAARALAVTLVLQAVHFLEEAATSFPERLGDQLGLAAMPLSSFVTFNLACLGIWILSIPGLRRAHQGAFFAAWFLAIAGMMNGILHPLLAVAASGYFPGLASAPVIGCAAFWLWFRLRAATRPAAA